MTVHAYTTRVAAVLGIVARGQAYRNLLYVLASLPVGLIYALLLLAALILDLLLVVLRAIPLLLVVFLFCTGGALVCVLETVTRVVALAGVVLIPWIAGHLRNAVRAVRRAPPTAAPPIGARSSAVRARLDQFWRPITAALNWLRQWVARWRWWIVLPELCWSLAQWESARLVRWLQIPMPPMVRPKRDAFRSGTVDPFPWTFLGYLLAKFPFGLLGVTLLYPALDMLIVLKVEPPQTMTTFVAVTVFVVALVIATLHGIAALVRLWGRFTYAMIGMNDAARRLRDAERLAAQERAKAERAEQSRRDLVVSVSHELRTPIASIRAHVESITLALDDEATTAMPPEALRSYLGIVQREAERLGSLVDELLAVARSETDTLQLTIAPVDAGAVIEEVYQALAPLARRERQVTLVRDVPSDVPPLLADRQRLAQVLLNLVRNAITYTQAGGIVSVRLLQTDHEHLVLAVADTGSGIAPADIDRIFERFYRTDASRARASGGFGLGLAIVRELVEAMGGAITVESTLGEGSCFAVRLPIAQPTTSAVRGA